MSSQFLRAWISSSLMFCLMPCQAAAQSALPESASPIVSQSANYQDVMREAIALHRVRRFKDALDLLSAYENEFGGDPLFDYQLGIAALEASQPAVAQQALERAVLVRPDFAGAWIDLALAHARLGEGEVAQQIIAHVESSFDVPLPLRDQLRLLRAELDKPHVRLARSTPNWLGERNGYLQLSTGHDSNANLGLASSVFSLTPIGGPPLQVAIPPSARAVSDSFAQLRGDWQQVLKLGVRQTGRLYLTGQYKDFTALKDYSLGDAALTYTHEYAWSQLRGWAVEGVAGVRGITIGGHRMATNLTAGVGLVAYARDCRWGARMVSETRDFGISGYVDADVPSLTLSTTCSQEKSQASVVLSFARDEPRALRAGGRTDRLELGIHYAHQLAPRLMMTAFGAFGVYRDAQGYSPLLENGAQRQVTRTSARLAWFWQFNPSHPEWQLHAELEHLQDRSNLEIFNVRNTRVSAGLRYQY